MLKKEQIRDRMLKTAARIWEIPEGEIETNFDPLILLMLEACAGELEQVSAGISATQDRLIGRLAELILPEAMLHARPASCIMQASPVEPVALLDSNTRFYTTQRMQQAGTAAYNQDFYFTPIGNCPLLKINHTYTRAGGKYYRSAANGQKELVHDTGQHGLSRDIWLALSPDKTLTQLKGLQFFFDMKGHSEARALYDSLHQARAYINGVEVPAGTGYSNNSQFDLNLEEALSAGYDYSRKVQRQIAGIYRNRFLHLNGSPAAGPGELPESWTGLPDKMIQQLQSEGTIYIRIVLGRMFRQDTLDRLSCSINAFPVINRSLNSLNYRTDTWVNIIPMPTEGGFLDLHSITGSSGNRYKVNTSADGSQVEEGEAIVRNGGVGKTNSREVREIIGSLMEAIRDESAYFSRMSNEFVLARLREITRILARLEDQMKVARDKKESLHYLLLKPATAGESVSISYWTTNGAEAHAVKAGTVLTAFNHTLTGAKGAFMLTNATGGKAMITEAEKKYILRRQLSSGGKIVSAEDIRLLSYQLFGDRLQEVSVQKGVRPGNGANQGFQRSIDIFLTFATPLQDQPGEEIDFLCAEMEYHLGHQASPVYPFRIILQ